MRVHVTRYITELDAEVTREDHPHSMDGTDMTGLTGLLVGLTLEDLKTKVTACIAEETSEVYDEDPEVKPEELTWQPLGLQTIDKDGYAQWVLLRGEDVMGSVRIDVEEVLP